MRALFIAAAIGWANATIAALPLPQHGSDAHLGVASCATSVCHGKVAPVRDGNVALNEYRVWSSEDHHARAYQVLGNELSKSMAAALDLPSAQTAKICLDCHADNVAAGLRGAKFQLSDGIGCEACHGGSERWIETHTDTNATHADNLARGMYPTDDPYTRATLCLSCHMGDSEKFATHQLMAAGHPRLIYELDAFSVNQPAHYVIDADYQKRKGAPAPGYVWLVGQVESAKQWSRLLHKHRNVGATSELAVYDCHACHHPMKPPRGQPNDFSAGLPVGSLRLLDAPFDMLAAIIAVLDAERAGAWGDAVRAVQRAGVAPTQLPSALEQLDQQLQQLENSLRASPPTIERIRALRAHIAKQAAAGRYADFSSAEQAYLALESLSYAVGDRDAFAAALDAMYDTVADENRYQPARFAATSQAFTR